MMFDFLPLSFSFSVIWCWYALLLFLHVSLRHERWYAAILISMPHWYWCHYYIFSDAAATLYFHAFIIERWYRLFFRRLLFFLPDAILTLFFCHYFSHGDAIRDVVIIFDEDADRLPMIRCTYTMLPPFFFFLSPYADTRARLFFIMPFTWYWLLLAMIFIFTLISYIMITMPWYDDDLPYGDPLYRLCHYCCRDTGDAIHMMTRPRACASLVLHDAMLRYIIYELLFRLFALLRCLFSTYDIRDNHAKPAICCYAMMIQRYFSLADELTIRLSILLIYAVRRLHIFALITHSLMTCFAHAAITPCFYCYY